MMCNPHGLSISVQSHNKMADDILLETPRIQHQRRFTEAELPPDCLDGNHHWYTTSHGRPTYCNVCREALGGVTSHGLSCEICKYKVHKRCSAKTINNCKWTTLSSIGKDIIEDSDGNITMPHQWMEGNLPVSAKCIVCEKNCGSVLRMQDWRCLWCKSSVHTHCRPNLEPMCPLGPARLSIVPPTALHSLEDETWEAIRPQSSSPLLVFVNSKAGDNQGMKFLRRFKQLLNPAQVFDLMLTGPRPGLRLFRHFDPFRILVCSGDGSVGWVLSEIDKLDLHKQCQLAVLPLGTGNDLARVLGWGSACDDDTHLLQLLEKYEKSTTKMLDRWSIMTFERFIPMPKLSLTPTAHTDGQLQCQIEQYESTLTDHLQNILQSDDTSVILNSSKRLCEIIKTFAEQIVASTLSKTDEQLTKKCDVLQHKLELLLSTLTSEQINMGAYNVSDGSNNNCVKKTDDTDSELSTMSLEKKCEKEFSNFNFRRHRRTSRFMLCEKDALIHRANSLKKAIRNLIEHTEQAVDEQNQQTPSTVSIPTVKVTSDGEDETNGFCTLPSIASVSSSNTTSTCVSPSGSLLTAKIVNMPPILTARRSASGIDDVDQLLAGIPVPSEFADSRRSSGIQQTEQVTTVVELERRNESTDSVDADRHANMSHVDSSETDTNPISDQLQVDSLIEDMSSLLREMQQCDFDQESLNNTYMDDTLIEKEMSAMAQMSSKRTHQRKENDTKNELKLDNDTAVQFGFENRAFLPTQHLESLERLNALQSTDITQCSLMETATNEYDRVDHSILQRHSITSTKLPFNADTTNDKTFRDLEIGHSRTTDNLIKLQKEDSNTALTSEMKKVADVNVIVEPPSPVFKRRLPSIRYQLMDSSSDLDLSYIEDANKNNETVESSKSSLLNVVTCDMPVHNLPISHSPAATRRISSCSLLNQVDSAALAAIANTSQAQGKSETNEKKEKKEHIDNHATEKEYHKRLPIINPLVRSPAWPNVSSGPGFISKCLLANADTLCAAVGPLLDPDEMLSEGFYERCVMNNYFGIGIDAKICLDFHQKREEHPEKCRSRTKNYVWYGVLGSKQLLQKTYKNLEQRVQLECDGQKIPLPSLQGIVILNIPSFMGGANFWGSPKEDHIFLPQSFDDRILEIVAVFGSVQMAASRLINLQHHRIAQCHSVQITILGEEDVPIQVDGEAWVQPPGIIRIVHKNRMQMLCRNRSLETSLKAWEEKQRILNMADASGKHGRPYHDKGRYTLTRQSMPASTFAERSFLGVQFEKLRQRSVSGSLMHSPAHQMSFAKRSTPTSSTPEPELAFTDEEHYLLIAFIDCVSTLTKLIKLLAISNTFEVDLYKIATHVEYCLEKCHPHGKLLEGLSLRRAFGKLVAAFKELYEESCSILHDRNVKVKLRDDLGSKLSISLANTEFELKKCIAIESINGETLIFLQSTSGGRGMLHDEHKRKGLSWLKFRSKSASPVLRKSRLREVCAWGTEEVATWLDTLQLSEYVDTFIKHDIRGKELISLGRRDLKDLQITKVGHLKRILQAIDDLSQGS